MMEQLIKAVKRGNKKRSINITIGAVVGFLLSCTTLAAAGEIGKKIEGMTNPNYDFWNKKEILGTASSGNAYGLYVNSSVLRDIINGDDILGSVGSGSGRGYGIYLNSVTVRDIINNKYIAGTAYSGSGYGIYLSNTSIDGIAKLRNIENNGTILGESKDFGYGISNGGGSIEILTNSGSIIGKGNDYYGYGISNVGAITFLTNSGSIIGTGNKTGYGIYNDGGSIGILTNNGSIIGEAAGYNGNGIYNDGGSIGILTNSGLIAGKTTGNSYGSGISNTNGGSVGILTNSGLVTGTGNTYGYGISNAGSIEVLTNSGSIIGIGNDVYDGYGISNVGSNIGTLTNSGLIAGTGKYGYGIYNAGAITFLTNSGLIAGTGKYGYGISINGVDSSIEALINSGSIIGIGNVYSGSGIYNYASIGTLTNSGTITGKGNDSGFGIYNRNSNSSIETLTNSGSIVGTGKYGYGISNESGSIGTLTNIGVIYGDTNAVRNAGTINSLNNYGILATKGSSVVKGTTAINYGMYISDIDGKITIDSDKQSNDPREIIVGSENGNEIKRNMTIKNASIESSSGGTSTDSFIFSGNSVEFDNLILNGKDKTLKVSDAGEIKGSVINAYGTAVTFDNTAGGELTLSGTIVNGGADGVGSAVLGSGNGDTLILQSGEIEYADSSKGTQNTIINGAIDMGKGADTFTVGTGSIINGNIDMGADNDTFTIETGSIINGTLDGGSGSDILNFNSPVTRTSNNDEINILHNISGFQEMNINTNVTLFETAIGNDGKTTGLTVTDAENITIGENGALTLRIDSARIDGADKIVGHALYENDGTISSTGGKLLLALNGAGNGSIISFGDTKLGDGLVTGHEISYGEKITFDTTSLLHSVGKIDSANNEIKVTAKADLPTEPEKPIEPEDPAKPVTPDNVAYEKLNKIYHSILSVDELDNFNVDDTEKLSTFLEYLNDIYAGNPYSYSSELSRKSMGMFRDIVTENIFRPETNKWMIYGGLTHIDGGTKDTYYGKGYYTYDIGNSNIESDTKITGAYILGEYGISDTLTSGVVVGGNKLKSDLSNGSKVDGSAMYIGGYVKKHTGNLKLTAGAGLQYGDYDTDRMAVNRVASSIGEPVMKYSDNYNDMTYDIYLNGRYSHNIGENLFLEPYGTLSYTYIDQDGAKEGNKALAIETDSKSFDYTAAKVGVDIKKVIPHEKGKSTLSAGVSYTRLLSGADEEHIKGRFKSGRDFDILVAHKNEHSIGLNGKYALELENGMLFDVKGTYAVERDSNNNSGKNKTKGEWIVGAGLGYKF